MYNLIIKKITIILGSLFLFLISPYVSAVFPFIPHIKIPSVIANIAFPGNVTMILMPLLLKDGAFFFIPGCFVILSLFFYKKNYIHFFTGLVSILMMFDIAWIKISWHSGVLYQNIKFVTIVTAENGLCFFIIFLLIAAFYKWREVSFLYFSALFLCLTLTFFAFPWFGESI